MAASTADSSTAAANGCSTEDYPADLLPDNTVQDIVAEFPEVFTDAPPHGGSQIELDFEVIPLQDGTSPVLRPMFRYSPFELEEMQRQIDQLLALGYIRPSASPYG